MSRRVLVTGFEPFGGAETNPSEALARALDGTRIAAREVVGRVLPCTFARAPRQLRGMLDELRPSLVIALGQAGGADTLRIERVAINLDDARIPDNRGAQPIDRPVVRGGPPAYFSTLPIKACLEAVRAAGVPASVSNSAGTFVCNHVFYVLMHELKGRRGVRGGFVHVPYSPDQGCPSLPLAVQLEAVRRIIETACTTRRDSRRSAGTLD